MGRKYIEFRLNLDGVDYTQKVGFPDDIPIERIEMVVQDLGGGNI